MTQKDIVFRDLNIGDEQKFRECSQEFLERRIRNILQAIQKEPSSRISFGRLRWVFACQGFVRKEFFSVLKILVHLDVAQKNHVCAYFDNEKIKTILEGEKV